MMIKSNGQYFDFDGDIEIEDRIKLFEDPENSNGAFSYDIELPDTDNNRKIFNLPFADTIKSIYQAVPSEVIDDTGQIVYTGKLQLSRIANSIMTCVFYSGNTEWFGLLSDPLSSLPLYRYDVELTEANIMASWTQNSGIVFPIMDTGGIITRAYANFKVEDFTSQFYVKTLFQEIFNPLGIKLEGELLSDPMYNSIGVVSNAKSQDDVTNRSAYVQKTTGQNAIASLTKVTFQNDSIHPFFNGSQGNYSTTDSEYVSDVKQLVLVDLLLLLSVPPLNQAEITIRVNGVPIRTFIVQGTSQDETLAKNVEILLNSGDVLTVFSDLNGGTPFNINSGNIRITPLFIYKVFGVSSVPAWTKGQFVSNILRIFNVLPSYNPANKTLTLNLFNRIKDKEPIDISDCIEINEIDYSEFVSDFAKNNIFKYQESNDEDLRQYNISNFISYGSGNLTIDNDFIQNTTDVLESDFTSPITYLNGVFDMSMERINFVELEETRDREITSVTDSSGIARFNITNADDVFTVGDLVRIETELDTYNGDWVVDTVTSTYIQINGGDFDANTTGTAILLKHQFTTEDNVYLFANIHNIRVDQFSNNTVSALGVPLLPLIEDTGFHVSALAYFNILSNGTRINTKFKQSLSFGEVNNPLSYQKTILDTYWPVFSNVLADPVKLKTTAYFDRIRYEGIKTFLRPLRIRTNETNNLYYANRITGYKDSSRPCNPELIKL